MDLSTINKLNKMQLAALSESDAPKLLWIMASSHENRSTLTFAPHSHNFFELHAVLEGELSYAFGERTESVKRGEFIIFPPKLLHGVKDCTEHFLKLTVAFSLNENGELFRGFSSPPFTAFEMTDVMAEIFDFLIKCAQGNENIPKNALKMRLAEAVYCAADIMNIQAEKAEKGDENDPRLCRAKKYVEDNPEIFFSCEEIAAFCLISSKQLSRIFKATEGVSLFEYIRKEKLESAKKLLLTTKLLECEIASRLGFSSVQYFSKFFSKYAGISPFEFRKNNL